MARNMARWDLSHALDTARKRLNRQAARLEKRAQSESSGFSKSLRAEAANLREQANTFRSTRSDTVTDLKAKLEQANKTSEVAKVTYQRGMAETRSIAAETALTGQAGSNFMAATKSLWHGKSGDRMENIVSSFNENAWKITDETRTQFREKYGYDLRIPLDSFDVINLVNMNMGLPEDVQEMPGTPTLTAQAGQAYVAELVD